jgi:hypothetical protein
MVWALRPSNVQDNDDKLAHGEIAHTMRIHSESCYSHAFLTLAGDMYKNDPRNPALASKKAH